MQHSDIQDKTLVQSIIFIDFEKGFEKTMMMMFWVSLAWLKKLDDIWMMAVMELPRVHFHAILLTNPAKKVIDASEEVICWLG